MQGTIGVSEDGKVKVKTAGGKETAGIWKDGQERVNQNEGCHRGRPGMSSDCWGWAMRAGSG